jgi:hypothetical protein
MRPHGVVVDAPGLDDGMSLGHAAKPVFVQALISEVPLKLST